MIRINLLPHREEKRKQRRTQFYVAAVGAVVGGAVVWGLVHGVIAGYVDAQEDKNAFLTKKIAELDREIDEIKRLREQMDALSSRKRVIESLQGNRFEAVGLMDELAKQTPEGVYLKSVKQTGSKVALAGYAQSSARVSTLMRNLEASPLLEKPDLVEIKAATVDKRSVSEFSLSVTITRAKEEAAKTAPAGATAGGART